MWNIVGRRLTPRSRSSITKLKLGIQKWAPAKCNDENYQYEVRRGFNKSADQ